MPLETSVTTKEWKPWAPGTSRKSETQPLMSVPVVPSGVVATTSWEVPGANAGAVAESCELETKTGDASTPPIVSVVGSAKSVPKTVNDEPPVSGPEAGLIEKRIRGENSDVLPAGSVAVAAMRAPLSV